MNDRWRSRGLTTVVHHRRGVLQVVDGLAVEGHPERRFPAGQLPERPPGHGEGIGVEKGETGPELPGEGCPVVLGECHHGVGVGVAGQYVEAVVGGPIGVGPAVGQAKGQGTDGSAVGVGEDPGPAGQALGQVHPVKDVEVDGPEAVVVHEVQVNRGRGRRSGRPTR